MRKKRKKIFFNRIDRILLYARLFLIGITFKKFINIVIIELSRILKKEKPKAFPYLFIIDATNHCNLKCPLCLTGSGLSSREKGFANLDLYKTIVDQIEKYALHIFLYNWGEP